MSTAPGKATIDVSVVVATLDRPQDLRWLISSLAFQSVLPKELIVMDASGEAAFNENEQSLRLVFGNDSTVQHIPALAGLTRQRNLGIKSARGSVVLFLDDDVILSPDYLRDLDVGFRNHHNALGLTGNIVLERPRGRASSRIRRAMGFRDFRSAEPTWLGEVGYIRQPSADIELNILPGCNMAYRRQVFDVLGLRFDELLSGYGLAEDYVFSAEVARFGRLVQLSSALLVHNTREMRNWDNAYARAQIVNLAYFGRRTALQFGTRRAAVSVRILSRGVRASWKAALSRDIAGAWELFRLAARVSHWGIETEYFDSDASPDIGSWNRRTSSEPTPPTPIVPL